MAGGVLGVGLCDLGGDFIAKVKIEAIAQVQASAGWYDVVTDVEAGP